MTTLLSPKHDHIVREALLGLQFHDHATGSVVADGLQVMIEDLWRPGRSQALAANRSGVYALHRFAGQLGFGEDAIASPTSSGRFRITAHDENRRYLPVSIFPVVPTPGLHTTSPGSEGKGPGLPMTVALYSAVTRQVPVGMSCLRAELRAAGTDDQPIPWARLELWLGMDRLASGLSDSAGRTLLVFPLPRPRAATLRASPAGSGSTPWTWTVTLRAFHDPALPAGEPPDMDDIERQPEVGLIEGTRPPRPLAPFELVAGEALIARSAPSSFLYVAV